MGFLDIRIEKTERAIKQAFMELRAQKPLEKIKVKELCDLACINKSTFYAHYQDIYALANAMEDEMVEVVVESLPQLTARDVSERTEWLTREMFRAFTRNQTEIGILFSGSRQGLFINRVEAAMSKCISESDPSFDADVVRKIVLSFCVSGLLLHLHQLLRPDGRKAAGGSACVHCTRGTEDPDVTQQFRMSAACALGMNSGK